MVKIISKQEIKDFEKQAIINGKKESIEISKMARPPEEKKLKIRIPRKTYTQAAPKRPPTIDKTMIEELIKKNRPTEEFTEYKESIDRILINSITKCDPSGESLCFKEKLTRSKDINTIFRNSVLNHLELRSYPSVFLATVLSFWFESKLNVSDSS